MPPDITLRQEVRADHAAVEALYAVAFGPGRHARTAWRLRAGVPHDPATAVVADRRGLVIGAIRQTRVRVGGSPAYLLGPLAVAETAAKQGIGRALLATTIEAASHTRADAIVLVGDLAFYAASGFERCGDRVTLPGPAERHRILQSTLRRPVTGPLAVRPW